ncbi:MAG TPA: PEP/pyruvate-binding domain-containing protein [Solirubrobacterales bacterium]|nr:PEP/pyruvate-binding domain-containing protein [Solirubrobacterales bacterium]
MASEGGKVAGLRALGGFASVPPFVVFSGEGLDRAEIAKAVARGGVRPPFAVRSSADVEDGEAAAFAGMFETKLRVEPEGLLEAVREVADSVSSERLDAYLEAAGVASRQPQRMHVIVQSMVDSRVSGVCASRLPEDIADGASIEAVFGLGELLVSGAVEPDLYRVDRSNRAVENVRIGNQVLQLSLRGGEHLVAVNLRLSAKLTPLEAVAVAEIAFEAEERFGWAAADIEWAYEGEKLWALQARPVASMVERSRP